MLNIYWREEICKHSTKKKALCLHAQKYRQFVLLAPAPPWDRSDWECWLASCWYNFHLFVIYNLEEWNEFVNKVIFWQIITLLLSRLILAAERLTYGKILLLHPRNHSSATAVTGYLSYVRCADKWNCKSIIIFNSAILRTFHRSPKRWAFSFSWNFGFPWFPR